MYAAQALDTADEEAGSLGRAGSRRGQIQGAQGGSAEAYFMYAAQADDEANEEAGSFLSPRGF